MRNNRIRMLTGIGSAIMLLWFTGCQTTNTRDERSEGTVLDDNQITDNVRHALDTDPVYKFSDVNVNTFAGVVQLSGFATIQNQKDRAQRVAENVNGARQVVNGITLKPTPMQATGGRSSTIYDDPPGDTAAPAAPAASGQNQNDAADQNAQSK